MKDISLVLTLILMAFLGGCWTAVEMHQIDPPCLLNDPPCEVRR